MAAATAKPKRKYRRGAHTVGFDPKAVFALRELIGRQTGTKRASRETLAKLLEASPNSIYNWERGSPPSRVYVTKLAELRRRIVSGELQLGKRSGARATKTTRRAAPMSKRSSPLAASRRRSAVVAPGTGQVLYANAVNVAQENGVALLRFGVASGGSNRAAPVVELIVPTDVLALLAR